jgi:hypothetical protein
MLELSHPLSFAAGASIRVGNSYTLPAPAPAATDTRWLKIKAGNAVWERPVDGNNVIKNLQTFNFAEGNKNTNIESTPTS